jgi:hypothetical protein
LVRLFDTREREAMAIVTYLTSKHVSRGRALLMMVSMVVVIMVMVIMVMVIMVMVIMVVG